MRTHLVWIIFILTSPALAQVEAPRGNSINALGLRAKDNYYLGQIHANVGIDSRWQVEANLKTEKSDISERSTEAILGGNIQASREWLFRFKVLQRNDPNELRTGGVGLGADWLMSSLWQGEQKTLLSGNYTRSESHQRHTSRAERRLAQRVTQHEVTAGVHQDLTSAWEMGLAHTIYTYSPDSGMLNQSLGNLTYRQTINDVPIDSLPLSSTAISTSVHPSVDWTFGLIASRTYIKLNTRHTDAITLSVDYRASSNWDIGLLTTSKKIEDGERSLIDGIRLNYRW